MIAIRQIVCAVDFSDVSRRALDHAAAVARRFNACLTVFHAYPSWSALDTVPLAAASASDLDPEALQAALHAFVEPISAGQPVTLELTQAEDVRGAIVRETKKRGADLLVLGSHGRGGFDHLLLGSVAEKVVRTVGCQVLVVPPRAMEPARDGGFRQIVCGVDFSAVSLAAARYAIQFAADEAAVTLVHAIEMPPEVRETQIVAAFDVDAVRAATEAACLKRLQSLELRKESTHCEVSARVLEGRAYRQMLRVAAEQQADLIVLGSQGRSALDRLVFGSNTHAVLRDAPCPVLTVHA